MRNKKLVLRRYFRRWWVQWRLRRRLASLTKQKKRNVWSRFWRNWCWWKFREKEWAKQQWFDASESDRLNSSETSRVGVSILIGLKSPLNCRARDHSELLTSNKTIVFEKVAIKCHRGNSYKALSWRHRVTAQSRRWSRQWCRWWKRYSVAATIKSCWQRIDESGALSYDGLWNERHRR